MSGASERAAKNGIPRRIQLRRTKGWRKPEGAVVVSRPTRWGNPVRVLHRDGTWDVVGVDVHGPEIAVRISRRDALQAAVDWYRSILTRPGKGGEFDRQVIRDHLAGADLACWCKPDEPCHADVLLEIANAKLSAGPIGDEP